MLAAILNSVEMFYWVDPEFRGEVAIKLYNEFIAESKRRGATRVLMAYMERSDPERMKRFYLAKKFVPFEHHMLKDI